MRYFFQKGIIAQIIVLLPSLSSFCSQNHWVMQSRNDVQVIFSRRGVVAMISKF